MKNALKYLVSFGLAAGLLVLIFRNIDLAGMVEELKKVHYGWVLLSMVISVTSHISRGVRWNILLKPLGFNPGVLNATAAIMVGYMANYAVPRIGEVTRCSILNRTNKVPVSESLGTVVTERLLDVLMLFLLIALCLLLEFSRLSNFFIGFFREKFSGPLMYVQSHPLVWIIPVSGILVSGYLVYRLQDKLLAIPFVSKLAGFATGLVQGLLSVSKIEKPGWFIFHTLNIWFFYFVMTWLILFSVEDSASLTPIAALVAMVLGGLGMAAPVQGGVGAYHILVSSALMLYGISYEKGILLATIMHASQMLNNILLGIVGLLVTMGKKEA